MCKALTDLDVDFSEGKMVDAENKVQYEQLIFNNCIT